MLHVDNASRDPEPDPLSLLAEAVRCAEERHWEVVPGTWLLDGDGAAVCCSCGDPGCALPGAHPVGEDWGLLATVGASVVRGWWTERPDASILLPTGRAFDVLDVPEVAGCLALARMERMGLQLGPVLAAPAAGGRRGRRLHFLVLPGAAAKLPDLLRQIGCPPGTLDLVARGEGDWVAAPPSRFGGHATALWARPPTLLNRWLPDAVDLVGPLAYACLRDPSAPRTVQREAAAVR
ncbi:bifunctional DNA primase/polymerase [Kitasatospora sp. CB01950]|uniref:bifunctional DNA primase/polymerase n=1 Tax=Kitasatospora sp. CB01950 TaxID=1703930 RepID=UPI00093C67D1|nr:bifunctional DNA primase/polymerase [Kitasatospora sp. CB01950]OKJ11875.1 DNA primase [Kitasatospora sp. CB01950]